MAQRELETQFYFDKALLRKSGYYVNKRCGWVGFANACFLSVRGNRETLEPETLDP